MGQGQRSGRRVRRTLTTKPQEKEILDVLHSEPYVDKAPAQVWASMLDQGMLLCCVRTMYRILAANGEVRERRDQRRHQVLHICASLLRCFRSRQRRRCR